MRAVKSGDENGAQNGIYLKTMMNIHPQLLIKTINNSVEQGWVDHLSYGSESLCYKH